MNTVDYLIFKLNELQCGVATSQIQEIIPLPEFIPIPDAPDNIIGVLNVRNSIIPIVHLPEESAQGNIQCHVDDNIVIIAWREFQIGFMVNQIQDIRSINISEVKPVADYDLSEGKAINVASGIVEINNCLTLLLDPDSLIRQPEDVAILLWELKLNGIAHLPEITQNSLKSINTYAELSTVSTTDFVLHYCPRATPKEQHILRQRAFALSQPLEHSDISHEMSLAAIRLGDSYIGIDLEHVREFTNVVHIAPIPCCPPHIVGYMNLRGEIIVLVDIRHAVGLPPGKQAASKAIIVNLDNVTAGIVIDEVLDIIDLLPTDLLLSDTEISQFQPTFLQGTIQYYQNILAIINLPKVFSEGALVVDYAA